MAQATRSVRAFDRKSFTGKVVRMEHLENRALLSAVLPGSSVGTLGTTAAARPELAGTVIYDALQPFSVTNAAGVVFKGMLQDRVVRENVSGTLDFYQQIRSDTASATAFLAYVTRGSYGGFNTDVDYRTDGTGVPTIHPNGASRSADGKSIRFNYPFVTILPGASSLFYFVKTNAKSYDLKGDTAVGFGQGTTGAQVGSAKLTTAEPIIAAVKVGKITGTKFNDLNADGAREKNEPGLAKWEIYIDQNKNGKLDSTEPRTFTDVNGNYSFSNVPVGTYEVREVQQRGWRQTTPAATYDIAVVTSGGTASNENFGNTRAVVISGTVFLDANQDAKRGPSEIGIAGILPYIDTNNDGKFEIGEPTAQTDAAGNFTFVESAGKYHVRVADVQGLALTTPSTGEYVVTLASGQVAQGLLFGEKLVA